MLERLRQIDRLINELGGEATSIRWKICQVFQPRQALLYTLCRIVSWIRKPRLGMTAALWRIGLILNIPWLLGVASLVIVTELRGSKDPSLQLAFSATALGLFVVGFALFYPSDATLSRLDEDANRRIEEAAQHQEVLHTRLHEIESTIRALQRERNGIAESIEFRRMQIQGEATKILTIEWQAAQGVCFEEFLERVFRNLGAKVETTPASGDQGVDLIVTISGRRFAVQAKGGVSKIGNKAVMEVFAGMKFYNCDSCIVITNSTFTRQAREIAERVECLLIEGSAIVDLALGKHALFEPQLA